MLSQYAEYCQKDLYRIPEPLERGDEELKKKDEQLQGSAAKWCMKRPNIFWDVESIALCIKTKQNEPLTTLFGFFPAIVKELNYGRITSVSQLSMLNEDEIELKTTIIKNRVKKMNLNGGKAFIDKPLLNMLVKKAQKARHMVNLLCSNQIRRGKWTLQFGKSNNITESTKVDLAVDIGDSSVFFV
eukprot:UN24503